MKRTTKGIAILLVAYMGLSTGISPLVNIHAAQISETNTKNKDVELIDMELSFPDANFRSVISYMFQNYIQDGKIDKAILSGYGGSLNISGWDIKDGKGIELFESITELNCANNQFASLDIGKHTKLKSLNCSGNQLVSLDLSNNTELTKLQCNQNQLTTLNVHGLSALQTLECKVNALTSLDVSTNTGLTRLAANNNRLTSLDLSHQTELTMLSLDNHGSEEENYFNHIVNLDLSANTKLTQLYVYNIGLTGLDLSKQGYLEGTIDGNNLLYIKTSASNRSFIPSDTMQVELSADENHQIDLSGIATGIDTSKITLENNEVAELEGTMLTPYVSNIKYDYKDENGTLHVNIYVLFQNKWIVEPSIHSWTYGKKASIPNSGLNSEKGEVNLLFGKVVDGQDITYEDWDQDTLNSLKPGKYAMKATVQESKGNDRDYKELTCIDTFTVMKKEAQVTTNFIKGWTYGEQPEEKDIVKLTTSDPNVDLSKAEITYYNSFGNKLKDMPTAPGTYRVMVTIPESAYAEDVYQMFTKSAEFTIEQAKGSVSISMKGWTRGHKPNEAVITSSTHEVSDASIWYKSLNDKNAKYTQDFPKKAGSYEVMVSLPANKYYGAVKASTTFEIKETDVTFLEGPSIKDWTYGDQAFQPVAKTNGGQVRYYYVYPDGKEWSSLPVAASSYVMKAELYGDDGELIEIKEVPFHIYPKSADGLVKSDLKLDDIEHLTLMNHDQVLLSGVDFDVTQEQKDGYTVYRFIFKGNYTGEYVLGKGEDKTTTVDKENLSETPATYDMSNFGLWVGMLWISTSVLVVLSRKNVGKNKQER